MAVVGTILVDGADLSADGVRTIMDWEGVVDVPDFRGANVQIPYKHGEDATPRWRNGKPVVVYMLVEGSDFADLTAKLEALYGLLPTAPPTVTDPVDTSCVLTRRIATTDKTADATFEGGAEPAYQSNTAARLTLRFRLLDGQWT